MRYAVWEADVAAACETAGLTQHQRALVEGMLRSLEPGTYLTEHVAGLGSAVLALTRAHHALQGHVVDGQPRYALTLTQVDQALGEIRAAEPAFNTTPASAAAISKAFTTLQGARAALTTHADKATKLAHAKALGTLLGPTALAARGLFGTSWNSKEQPAEVAAQIRAELAVLTVLEGRDGLALRVDLLEALRRGLTDTTALADLLWPKPTRYLVTVVVHGTRLLEDLDRLLPGARQWPLIGNRTPPDLPRREMRSLIAATQAHIRPSVLVRVPVQACDANSAIGATRREVSEVLDQYAAGQRLLVLTLGRPSMAITEAGRFVGDDDRLGGNRVARPLTRHWSASLRSALRMAQLAAQVESPMASTALAWSALETLGADKHMEEVAKAAALHSVRQQILSLYKTVVDSAGAKLKHTRERVYWAEVYLGRSERALTRATQAETISPAAGRAAARHAVAVIERRADLAGAQRRDTALCAVLLPAMQTIRVNLLGGAKASDHPLDLSSWTLDLNGFLAALLPPGDDTPRETAESHRAIEVLAQHADGLAAQQLQIWRARLAHPTELATWLDYQQSIFHGLVTWMYATRNMAVHDGKFSAPTDNLTAQAARGLVDMVLEFLGNWHKTERARGSGDSEAVTVITHLARRKDQLVSNLLTASICWPLDIAGITAPDVLKP